MKRTQEIILKKGCYKSPKGIYYYIPKGIRSKILKKLCHVNFYLMFNEETPNLLDQPKKCVDYIMNICRVSKRTAYDYYTTLLHIHYYHQFFEKELSEILGNMAKSLEERGIDPYESLKLNNPHSKTTSHLTK